MECFGPHLSIHQTTTLKKIRENDVSQHAYQINRPQGGTHGVKAAKAKRKTVHNQFTFVSDVLKYSAEVSDKAAKVSHYNDKFCQPLPL